MIEIDFLPDHLLELIPVEYQSKPNLYQLSTVTCKKSEKVLDFIRQHTLFYRDDGKLELLSTPDVVTIGVCSSSFDEFDGLVGLLSWNGYQYKMFEQGDPSEVFFELDVTSIASTYSGFSTDHLLAEIHSITGEAEECFAITSLPYQELFTVVPDHWA